MLLFNLLTIACLIVTIIFSVLTMRNAGRVKRANERIAKAKSAQG